MATLKEFENPDNATGVMPEYRSKLTQMYQYLNRSVKKFLLDVGRIISSRQYTSDMQALEGGLKKGDLYSDEKGFVKVVKGE